MNKTDAAKTLNYYGTEQEAADRNNMDWMPDAASRRAIAEACEAQPTRLNKAGQALYESQYNPAVRADWVAGRA